MAGERKILQAERKENMRELIKLQKELRSGKRPETLGAKRLGAGCFKTAYRLGPWVIKPKIGSHVDNSLSLPMSLQRVGLRAPKQYIAGEWMIQGYVEPLGWEWRGKCKRSDQIAIMEAVENMREHKFYDTHCDNIGMAENGDLVCFDW